MIKVKALELATTKTSGGLGGNILPSLQLAGEDPNRGLPPQPPSKKGAVSLPIRQQAEPEALLALLEDKQNIPVPRGTGQPHPPVVGNDVGKEVDHLHPSFLPAYAGKKGSRLAPVATLNLFKARTKASQYATKYRDIWGAGWLLPPSPQQGGDGRQDNKFSY